MFPSAWMLRSMLTKDPRRRVTIPELLEHPWLAMAALQDKDKHRDPVQSGSKSHRRSSRMHAASPIPDAVIQRLQKFAAMNRFKKVRVGPCSPGGLPNRLGNVQCMQNVCGNLYAVMWTQAATFMS